MNDPSRDLSAHAEHHIRSAWKLAQRGAWPEAWTTIEAAHVLSQPLIWLHTKVHLVMLVFAVRTLDVREAAGQLMRIALAPIGSALARYPVGNTGRARISAFAPMPIAAEVQAIFDEVGRSRRDGGYSTHVA